MEEKEIYKEAINRYGWIAQTEMLLEESLELSLATRKFLREPKDKRLFDLGSEIADVLIMIEQFIIISPEINQIIIEQKEFKLKRLKERLDKTTHPESQPSNTNN